MVTWQGIEDKIRRKTDNYGNLQFIEEKRHNQITKHIQQFIINLKSDKWHEEKYV